MLPPGTIYISRAYIASGVNLAVAGSLNLRLFSSNKLSFRLSDAGVRYIVEGSSGPKLRELNLTNCLRVSDVSVLRIAQRYVFLRCYLSVFPGLFKIRNEIIAI